MDFSNIQPGQIFCTHISGSVGTLIGWGERLAGSPRDEVKYSHAGICLGGSVIVEAETNGARIGDLSEYNDGRPLGFSDLSLAQGKGQDIADRAKLLVGTPYGFLDYLAIALHHWHIGMLRLRAESSKTMICSQLAAYSYKDEGIDLFPGLPTGYVTPSMLAERVLES